jgi:arabinose-5-phosphate isomerase
MSVVKLSETKAVSVVASEASRVESTLNAARRVLETEANALRALLESLGAAFVQAVDMIDGADGRVIVTGMGKSGHVGKKIAATLASTGTPAFFVHPAEASHGDLGMIIRGDVVLALSNSGESRELFDIITYTRRYAIPLIGITSKADSTLAQRSDLALLMPDSPEACPNGLAPTTSTTLAMSLGDALSIALLERKGFTAENYKDIHPGGKLGQQLMAVSEIMQTGDAVPSAPDTTSMAETVRIMTEKGLGCIILTAEDGTVSGVVTDGDLRRNLFNDKRDGSMSWLSPSRSRRWKKSMAVAEIMNRDPLVITPKTLVGEAMAIMSGMKDGGTARRVTQLIVVDGERKPVGILHIHDALRAGFA